MHAAGLGSLAGGTALLFGGKATGQESHLSNETWDHVSSAMGPVGRVSKEVFDPTSFLRTFNFSDLSPDERSKVYRETPRSNGTMLREYCLLYTSPSPRDATLSGMAAWA